MRRATAQRAYYYLQFGVSIHARRATGDSQVLDYIDYEEFQFTPVVRRATFARGAAPRDCRRFNSRPSCDGRRLYMYTAKTSTSFNSRPSCDGRPWLCHPPLFLRCFNSRPSCDGRLKKKANFFKYFSFNSRPSCDGRRARRHGRRRCCSFNSRPSCDGRLGCLMMRQDVLVSIHARRATGDNHHALCTPFIVVSIHARRATGDRDPMARCSDRGCFNSRPSCDGRQADLRLPRRQRRRFNSRPSCDGRRILPSAPPRSPRFNSRPSCDGRQRRLVGRCPVRFQFTPVVRRATDERRGARARRDVSIHARRATGDTDNCECALCRYVSIHARRATGDRCRAALCWMQCFNSRPSCDGRHHRDRPRIFRRSFNSRPSCDGRPEREMRSARICSFQFTPVVRRATPSFRQNIGLSRFNSRPSCDGRHKD